MTLRLHNIIFMSFLLSLSVAYQIQCQSDAGKVFYQFVSSLPTIHKSISINGGLIDIPYHVDMMDGFRYPKLQADLIHKRDSAMIDLYRLGGCVYGRLFENKNFVTLLCGTSMAETNEPTIQTFSFAGTKIDSLNVDGGCGGEDNWFSRSYAVIGEDRSIAMVDTTFKWVNSKRRAFIPDTTIVHILRYRLIDTGRFEKPVDSSYIVK